MFNVGPLELVVLAIVAVVVIGPDKLPALARDAARMLKTLRDLATGAREQLRDELGPEFADVDLRNLNPKHIVTRAVFGDGELPDFSKYDPRRFDARTAARNLISEPVTEPATAEPAVDMTKAAPIDMVKPSPAPAAVPAADRPRPRPRPAAPAARYASDAT
jgi:sec-independent protein translocase protein TatB